MRIVRTLERIAYIRTEDNAIMGHSTYLVMPLYTEIARRLGLSYYELKEFKPWEIVKHLRLSRALSKKLLRARQALLCRVQYNGSALTLTGEDARLVQRVILNQMKPTGRGGRIFSGTVANTGIAHGVVKNALNSKDAMDITKGQVLIAPATSADFVPAMRKASAIVTEFGGITSHAAIVSREFGIPCIVGVREITKRFKTGDLVEVDATKGTVKKI